MKDETFNDFWYNYWNKGQFPLHEPILHMLFGKWYKISIAHF